MQLVTTPKIDTHCHILDPARFPYAADVAYRPAGQEIGTLAQYREVMDAYGVHHALLVGPNSGYGLDNRCLLDAIAQGAGRFKGIAVVRNDAGTDELQALQAAGIVGVAFNATLFGAAHYAATAPLLQRLADLQMFIQVQVEHDQLVALAPLLRASGARILIDHCGRPDPGAGIDQPGFQALLALGREVGTDVGTAGGTAAGTSCRAAIKLSGWQKFSRQGPPYTDALPFVQALIEAFTLDGCLWASDWPYLKATERLDYGPLLRQLQRLLPDPSDQHRVLWRNPQRLFGFAPPPSHALELTA